MNDEDMFDSSLSREKLGKYESKNRKLENLRSPYDLEFSNQLLRHNFNVELISNNAINAGTKAQYKIRRLKQPKKRSPLSSKIEIRRPVQRPINYDNSRNEPQEHRSNLNNSNFDKRST